MRRFVLVVIQPRAPLSFDMADEREYKHIILARSKTHAKKKSEKHIRGYRASSRWTLYQEIAKGAGDEEV